INAVGDRSLGRGMSLTHVASPTAARVDFDAAVAPVLSVASDEPATGGTQGAEGRMARPLTGPYGFPGSTFGGISIAGENRSLPPYTIALTSDAADFFRGGEGALAGGPRGFPIAPAGSKGWM